MVVCTNRYRSDLYSNQLNEPNWIRKDLTSGIPFLSMQDFFNVNDLIGLSDLNALFIRWSRFLIFK